MVFDLRLKENFKLFLSSPSSCGKTSFVSELINNIDQFVKEPPRKVIYFYKEWQAKFTDMEQKLGVHFIENNDMIIEQIKEFDTPALVIFDDMLNSTNLKAVAQLFTVYGRHLNLCLAFLTQRLFNNNEFAANKSPSRYLAKHCQWYL